MFFVTRDGKEKIARENPLRNVKITAGTDILELTSTDSTSFTIDYEQKTIIIWTTGTSSSPLITTIKVRYSSRSNKPV